jgi:DNA-directed RNA polymerase specialized sigma24 family protein
MDQIPEGGKLDSLKCSDDQELASLVRVSADPEEQEAARTILLERHYESFDRRIRAVLASRNLDYSPSSEYYNTLFFDVFHRTFTTAALRKKLATFRSEKGDFQSWFLGAVVVNEVKDWLKRRSGRAGVAMGELLIEEARAQDGPAGGLKEDLPAPEPEPADESTHDLDGLSPELAVVAELVFLAYAAPSERSILEIAGLRNESLEKVREHLEEIRNRLRNSEKFTECTLTELHLALERERIRHFESLAANLGSNLLSQRASAKELAWLEARSARPWKEIREDLKEARRACQRGELGNAEHEAARCRLEYEASLKRLDEHRRKLERIRNTIATGKHLVRMPNKEIAACLKIPEGTVASRINALRRTFRADESTDNPSERRNKGDSA